MAKTFIIEKQEVWNAYLAVKSNNGSAGIDGQSIEDFELKLKDNLYKIWNRLSSGSYFPPPVRRVDIPKANGKVRSLGIPTISDRIAQMVIKNRLEPVVEPYFHNDSYGYRPEKSALDAIVQARRRCFRDDWVLDLDIKGLYPKQSFDFLGYTFRPRSSRRMDGKFFVSFSPAVSRTACKAMRKKLKEHPVLKCTSPSIENVAKALNPVIQGWINYYGQFKKSSMSTIYDHINTKLQRWAMRKFKHLKRRKFQAGRWLRDLYLKTPDLFAHWRVWKWVSE